MKRILFFLFSVVLFSCEKEPACYVCTTTFTITSTYNDDTDTWTASDTQEFCEMTDEKAVEYETRNSGTSVSESSGIRITTKTLTECKK